MDQTKKSTSEKAVKWLADRGIVNHIDMIEAIRIKQAEILYAEQDGVMIYETDSQTCMIAAENFEPCRQILSQNTYHQFAVHQKELAEEIQAQYHFATSVLTNQAAWMQKNAPEFDDSGIIALKNEHAKEVCSFYGTMEDPGDYVRELISRGQLWGIFEGDRMAGFAGEHLEGSMGLLEILPEYRRKRYGFRLEAFLIRHFLEHGKLPFCQVIEGNTESMSLQKKLGMAIIMITHDLGVVADMADEIIVMYAGKIVEKGSNEEIFYNPRHPYTWALMNSVPRLDLDNKEQLVTIEGTIPDMIHPPKGCAFCSRCPYAMNICAEYSPETIELKGGHQVACWLTDPRADVSGVPFHTGGEQDEQ